jgi:outer membrane protein
MRPIRLFLTFVLANIFLVLTAQEGKFGYLDFNSTLKLMPEYLEAEINLQKMQSDYKAEIERSKREFERQYIEFMLEQEHLSASIVAKRQKELQLLMDNNAQFRDKVQEELESQRVNMLDPIKKKLLSVISKVCSDQGLDYVIDTGSQAYLVINSEKGVDISNSVFSSLGIENTTEMVPNNSNESGKSVIINKQQTGK